MLRKRGKKGAFELSITTMIIIVLAIVILIMGLTFLKKIFGSTTQSVDTLDQLMTKELNKIVTDESQTIVVYLTDKTAKIRAGTSNFNFWISAKTKYGNDIASRQDVQYKIELDKTSTCYKQNPVNVEKWFTDTISTETSSKTNNIKEYKGDTGYARIQLSIPSGTKLCTQTVLVDFKDNSNSAEKDIPIGGTSFTIEILRSGIF
jgi:hypothetical protein